APGSDRAVMVGGGGVVLAPESVVREDDLFVAVDLEGGGRRPDAVVRVASAVRREWLPGRPPRARTTPAGPAPLPRRRAAAARRRERYADLVLAETVRSDVDRARAGALLADAVIADPALLTRVAADHAPLLARLRFLAHFMPDCGLPGDPLPLLADAIRACATGGRSVAELQATDLGGALRGLLTHAQRTALERDAPSRLRLPTRRPP